MNTNLKNLTFAVSAAVSGVLNYYGFNVVNPDAAFFVKCLFAMTGVAVTMSIILFWNYAFGVLPELREIRRRIGAWVAIAVGVVLIVFLSSWWNLIALSGSEIARLNSTELVGRTEVQLANAIDGSGLYLPYRPGVASLGADIGALIDSEVNGGGTSGAAGEGAISNTMSQVETRVENLLISIDRASASLAELRAQSDACLAGLHAGGQVQIATQVNCANGVIADLGNQNVLSTIERGLATLTDGIVLPANLRTQRQRDVIAGFLADTKERADGMAAVIRAVTRPVIAPLSTETPNLMIGVLLNWKSLIPAIATALAIDLLPMVILLLTTFFKDDLRARGNARNDWTVTELVEALNQARLLRDANPQVDDLPSPFIDLPEHDWHDEGEAPDGSNE